MVLRGILPALLAPWLMAAADAGSPASCPMAFANPSGYRSLPVIKYPLGSHFELISSFDIDPDWTMIRSIESRGQRTERYIHVHRLNGEDVEFSWPAQYSFHEGASEKDSEFMSKMTLKLFEPGPSWEFYPPGNQSTLWRDVITHLDAVIDREQGRGSIDEALALFAKDYHNQIAARDVSHIRLFTGEGQSQTISIIHGGSGGGVFGGPFRDPMHRNRIDPARRGRIHDYNKLQIEVSFPDLLLPEREAYGAEADVYEIVRLAGMSTDSMIRLAPVIARHLAQKNGYTQIVPTDSGVYILAPTKAHQRLYEKFFRQHGIALRKIAEPQNGYAIFRFSLYDFTMVFLNVRFASSE